MSDSKIVNACVVLFFLVIFFGFGISYRVSGEQRNITVKSKESIGTENGHKYMVYCKGEVLSNEDSWIFLKFSSADLYNELEKGKTYKCTIAGWRIPFFSMTENIIDAELVK